MSSRQRFYVIPCDNAVFGVWQIWDRDNNAFVVACATRKEARAKVTELNGGLALPSRYLPDPKHLNSDGEGDER